MASLPYIVVLSLLLFGASDTLSEEIQNKSSPNLIYEEFSLFEFILINYTFISSDLLVGEGHFLDVLYRQAPDMVEAELYSALKSLLESTQTIPEFTRAAVDVLENTAG
tara:strand:- start:164 stop:490 length:327 start_codon:yes stop_codon:yes gene_type:complete